MKEDGGREINGLTETPDERDEREPPCCLAPERQRLFGETRDIDAVEELLLGKLDMHLCFLLYCRKRRAFY